MAKPTADKEKQRLLTPEFRVSYPHVFKPSSFKNSEPKYSVTGLFPKGSESIKEIQRAITNAKIAAYGPDKSAWPKGLILPVTDGDSPKYADKDGYKGHWAIKFSTKAGNKPTVVNEQVEPIIEASEFYPGCYARAYVFAYAWEFAGKEGISFILDHVQKTRDGKSFGGKKPAEQVFTPISAGPDTDVGDEEDFVSEDETEEQDFM